MPRRESWWLKQDAGRLHVWKSAGSRGPARRDWLPLLAPPPTTGKKYPTPATAKAQRGHDTARPPAQLTMAVMRALARPSGWRPAARWRRPRTARSLYTLPVLDNHDQMEREGLPPLFSPGAFKVAYTEYQQLMVNELNELTTGSGPAQHTGLGRD